MADSRFVDIFYNSGVRFSFGYISNERSDSFYPLPSCVQKGKNTNPPLYRLTLETNKTNLDNPNDIVKYKSLKSKFGILNTGDNTLELKDVDFRFNYHHQRDKEEMGKGLVKDTSFFQYKAILAGQYFKFYLEGKGEYLKALLQNLECLHVGKSRTAQYGTLEIDWNHSQYEEITEDSYVIHKDTCYLACVESPIILNNKTIDSNVDNLDLDTFMHTLNKKYPNLKIKDGCYSLSRRMVSGFNMQWKKSKPSVYAIAPESYVLLESIADEKMPDVLYVGKKCNEGFGRIRLLPISEKNHALTLKTENEKANQKESSFDSGLDAKAKAITEVKENKQLENFDSGLLSRMLLMLRQTKDYKEFKENLNKITNKGKKDSALLLLKQFEECYSIRNKDDVYMPYFFTLLTLIKYDQRKVNKKESKREGE